MKARNTKPARTAGVSQERGNRVWGGRRVGKGLRRDSILRSVGSVLRDRRLSALTMQSIADELGITKGNLYYYFRDKQDILFQCHMRCMEISLNALRDALLQDGSPAERLRTLLIAHIKGILEDGMAGVLLTDLEDLAPVQRKHYVAKRDLFEQGVRRLIEEGMAKGEFACADVKLAGFAILGAVNWIPKWYRPYGPLPLETIATGMTDFLMAALYSRRYRPASRSRLKSFVVHQNPVPGKNTP